MTRLSEKLETITKVPLFAGLTKGQQRDIARSSDVFTFDQGTVIEHEDQDGQRLGVILSGRAKVSRRGRKLASLKRNDVFGEMALIDGLPRSATITADSSLTVLFVYRSEFSKLLDTNPGVARRLLVTLSERLRTADRALSQRN